jgi:hypothetical protein
MLYLLNLSRRNAYQFDDGVTSARANRPWILLGERRCGNASEFNVHDYYAS